jgi:hypothetical protein
VPFQDAMQRAIHFQKHGHEFGAADEFVYEQMADNFMSRALDADTAECVRVARADRVRLGCTLRHFGVACTAPAFVRTFYSISQTKIANRGGCAGFLAHECARVNL